VLCLSAFGTHNLFMYFIWHTQSIYMFHLVHTIYLFVSFGSHNKQKVGTADGGTVVKVLRYKSEGRWFDPSWCNWNFSVK
jgi:hypothetical protein